MIYYRTKNGLGIFNFKVSNFAIASLDKVSFEFSFLFLFSFSFLFLVLYSLFYIQKKGSTVFQPKEPYSEDSSISGILYSAEAKFLSFIYDADHSEPLATYPFRFPKDQDGPSFPEYIWSCSP